MLKFSDLCTNLYRGYCNQFYAEPEPLTVSSMALEHAFRLGFVSGVEAEVKAMEALGPNEVTDALRGLREDTAIRCKELEAGINEILSPDDKGKLH